MTKMQKLSFLVKHADHEFKSTVVHDEATGGWVVTKEVQETGNFTDEQSAIEWSTQTIGTPPPNQGAAAAPMSDGPITPMKQPISSDEGTIPPAEAPVPAEQGPEPAGTDNLSPEESPFADDGFTPVGSRQAKSKVLASLQSLITSARSNGHIRLADNLNELKDKELLDKNSDQNKEHVLLAELKGIQRAIGLVDYNDLITLCEKNQVSVSEMSKLASSNGFKVVDLEK